MKADPLGNQPQIPAVFSKVISGFADEALTDEAVMLFLARMRDGKSFPAEKAKLLSLADRIEDRKRQGREEVGAYMAYAVEHLSADQAKDVFSRVVAMKRAYERSSKEGEIHRNVHAHKAYADFIRETKKEPSKPELRKFMMAHCKSRYTEQPDAGDGQGWQRLWKNAGLSGLASRAKKSNSMPATKPKK